MKPKEAKARLDPQFHREVSHALVDRGISLQQAIEEGLRLWLSPGVNISHGKELDVDTIAAQNKRVRNLPSIAALIERHGTDAVERLAATILAMEDARVRDDPEPNPVFQLPKTTSIYDVPGNKTKRGGVSGGAGGGRENAS